MVTATATAPYTKTLQGKFIIIPAISYEVNDSVGSPVATLAITLAPSAELTRNVTIIWGPGAAPDMTNPIVIAAVIAIDEGNGGGTMTVPLHTAAAYELVFFKDNDLMEYTEVTVVTMQE